MTMYDVEVLTHAFTSFKFEFLNLQLSLFWLSSESSPALAGGSCLWTLFFLIAQHQMADTVKDYLVNSVEC